MRATRALIIDDSLTIRAMVEQLLATQGHITEIATASDVPAARALMKSFKPTIITLDLNMPGIDGMALLDELRDYPHAPVVVVSSATTEGSDAAREAIEHGADACFDKGRILADSKRFIRVLIKASVSKRRAFMANPLEVVE
ncbi:response regulator [Sphingomonas antarctica]|uniref:response regulator n=1 Tax=Sphingomonas antarctica TaxID=2040274 RepID=UPI0039EB0311